MIKPTTFVILTILILTNRAGQAKDSENGWVSLSAWARENGFRSRAAGNKTIDLVGNNTTLQFQNESEEVAINGVDVWLCNPITVRGGQVCVSALDVKASIEPILHPSRNDAGKIIQSICLDPGHGGKDTGCKVGRCMEKNYTLPLALELREELRAAGFKVWLTRTNDQFVELDDRIATANDRCADLFISLHFNMAPDGEGKGVEVYCLTPSTANSTNDKKERASDARFSGNQYDSENSFLAYQMQRSLVKRLEAADRGLRRARFAVLRPARMPAVLIEGGFLSDPGERRKISDPNYRRRMADAIVEGILAYKRVADPKAIVKSAVPILRSTAGTE